jgi:MoxR-like ATPase
MATHDQLQAQALQATVDNGRHFILFGPPGSGKVVRLRAALDGRPGGESYAMVLANAKLTEEDLFMRPNPQAGATPAWIQGPLALAMTSGRAILIADIDTLPRKLVELLDEAMSPRGLPADRGTGRPSLKAKPSFMVVATAQIRDRSPDVATRLISRRFGFTVELPAQW